MAQGSRRGLIVLGSRVTISTKFFFLGSRVTISTKFFQYINIHKVLSIHKYRRRSLDFGQTSEIHTGMRSIATSSQHRVGKSTTQAGTYGIYIVVVWIGVAYILMACTVMPCIGMACTVKPCIAMAYTVMSYIATADTFMLYIAMAYTVMPYIVMAYTAMPYDSYALYSYGLNLPSIALGSLRPKQVLNAMRMHVRAHTHTRTHACVHVDPMRGRVPRSSASAAHRPHKQASGAW